MMSTIIVVASVRLSVFNIPEVATLTDVDTMELERIGMPMSDEDIKLVEINKKTGRKIGNGKIAYFIITKPSDSTFNFLASLFYTQIFSMIEINAARCGGALKAPLEIYMDEWAQLRRDTAFCRTVSIFKGLECWNNHRFTVANAAEEKV